MTPQDLAALPVGTRVSFKNDVLPDEPENPAFDYGVVAARGSIVRIEWDTGIPSGSLIDTKSPFWEEFILDIEVQTAA